MVIVLVVDVSVSIPNGKPEWSRPVIVSHVAVALARFHPEREARIVATEACLAWLWEPVHLGSCEAVSAQRLTEEVMGLWQRVYHERLFFTRACEGQSDGGCLLRGTTLSVSGTPCLAAMDEIT